MRSNSMRMTLVLLAALVVVMGAGCSRLTASTARQDRTVYNPPGTIAAEGTYLIGSRDTLEIVVWRCPELNSKVMVRPEDGRVTLPLVGDIKAAGLTPKELAQDISKRLAYYVKEPRVAVGVVEFGDKKVFVLGEVSREGTYHLERGDRIIDVISLAGGFTLDAVPEAVRIIRGGYDDPQVIRVNVARLMTGDTTQNIFLQEGDIVVVPKGEMADWNDQVVRNVLPTLYMADNMARVKADIMDGGYDWTDVWRKMGGKNYKKD